MYPGPGVNVGDTLVWDGTKGVPGPMNVPTTYLPIGIPGGYRTSITYGNGGVPTLINWTTTTAAGSTNAPLTWVSPGSGTTYESMDWDGVVSAASANVWAWFSDTNGSRGVFLSSNNAGGFTYR